MHRSFSYFFFLSLLAVPLGKVKSAGSDVRGDARQVTCLWAWASDYSSYEVLQDFVGGGGGGSGGELWGGGVAQPRSRCRRRYGAEGAK